MHGPLPTQSREGYKYWITFIDDHSRFWAVLPLRAKSDAFGAFKRFKAFVENQLNCTIKALRDDKGGEYMSKEWNQLCEKEGIKRQHTLRSEPHQNGVAEQANRTLAEGITTMLNEAHLPPSFWWSAAAAFVHVHNRSPTAAVKHATPYELWHKSKPDVSRPIFKFLVALAMCISRKIIESSCSLILQSASFLGILLSTKAGFSGTPPAKRSSSQTLLSLMRECSLGPPDSLSTLDFLRHRTWWKRGE